MALTPYQHRFDDDPELCWIKDISQRLEIHDPICRMVLTKRVLGELRQGRNDAAIQLMYFTMRKLTRLEKEKWNWYDFATSDWLNQTLSNIIRCWYTKSFCVPSPLTSSPFTNARESIMALFGPVLSGSPTRLAPIDASFVRPHGILFSRQSLDPPHYSLKSLSVFHELDILTGSSLAYKSSVQSFSTGLMDYTVNGLVGLGGHQVSALPDTGAKRNVISLELVKKLGLVVQNKTRELIRLPTGDRVKSMGLVQVPFTFLGESNSYLLDCCILPRCNQDLIICNGFLKATRTLTKFKHRIVKSLRKNVTRLQFNLLGNGTCRIPGLFNDIPISALADTGSDAMLISTRFAMQYSLDIDSSWEHRQIVQFGDGTEKLTTGIVRNVDWRFSSSDYQILCEFYVVDDLEVDVVLSKHLLFEYDVFSHLEEDIVDDCLLPEHDSPELCNIRLISKYSSELMTLESRCIADMNSTRAFSPEAVKAERVRRDQIRDAINALPPDQQDQAWRDERNRQEIWDGYRRRHSERTSGGSPAHHQAPVVHRTSWWKKGLLRKYRH